MSKNKNILALNELGQSIWYDNLSKAVLDSGELKGLIDQGVSGLTSNPTIFKKAIADSSDYDQELGTLSKQGLDAEGICEELMIADVGRAADLLKPTFLATNRGDGYASIEVSPFLATDTKSTLESAHRLWKKLARPNVMIKVPGTTEGIPAVRALLEEGINVNITLLFSVEVYAQVIEAYLGALEARTAKGEDLSGIASVASFFVSRVDTICEKEFDRLAAAGKVQASEKEKIFGKVGIANAKQAYAKFEEIFGGERFKKLAAMGARVQRPLWASTGTKNPTLSPVLYVEELAGRDTVNTVPPATLTALISNLAVGPRLHSGLAEATASIEQAGKLGIDFNGCLQTLQTEGVASFADSYRELLGSIENKRAALK